MSVYEDRVQFQDKFGQHEILALVISDPQISTSKP